MPQGVSRAVIEVLFDRVSQGAGTLSPEGHLTYANQRLATMLGVNRAQLIGKPLVELVAAPEREALSSTLESARDTAAQCRLVLPRSNGAGPIPALLTFAPLGHGQLSCIVTELGRNGTKEADSVPPR